MDDLDDPYSLSLISLVMMISCNLIFTESILSSFKTFFMQCMRVSISAIMHELGNKSKNYYHMSDNSFWKLHDILKNDINKNENISCRHRKKKKNIHSK